MGKKLVLGLIAVTACICTVRADIIPTLNSITGSAPNFTWNYTANVTVDQTVNSGDFFTIYDFSAIMPTTTTQPTGWTFSTSLLGPTPANVSPTDNPNLYNLTWTYSGSAIAGSSALGMFTVVTSTDQEKIGVFTAQATRTSGPQAGTKIANIGSETVPVPEPSALLPLLGVAAAAIFTVRLRRQVA